LCLVLCEVSFATNYLRPMVEFGAYSPGHCLAPVRVTHHGPTVVLQGAKSQGTLQAP